MKPTSLSVLRSIVFGDNTRDARHDSCTHIEHGEHGLRDVEGVSPVVVRHRSVVALDAQRPAAQHVVRHVELLAHAHVDEHAHCGLARGQLGEVKVAEVVAIKTEFGGRRDVRFLEHKHSSLTV